MGMSSAEREKIYLPMYISCVALFLLNLYWYGFSSFARVGASNEVVNRMFTNIAKSGLLAGTRESSYRLRLIVVVISVLMCSIKAGKPTKLPWSTIIIILVLGLVFYLFPWMNSDLYILLCSVGFVMLLIGTALLGRKTHAMKTEDNDIYETFEQCEKIVENDYSVNIRTRYQWRKKIRNGWINVVNPFRGNIILGTPGSGKSYSVFWSYIEQMITKGYSVVAYDYKMPDLTDIVYNEYLKNKDNYKKKYGVVPQFCIINFDNPRQSMRCNPLNAKYLTDMADAHEIADLIMKNVNPKAIENEDFFVMSAKVYIAALVWLLKKHDGGRYCTFPHLIELMGMNYEAVFEIMKQDKELTIMCQPFADALAGGAQEQLQGQIASARMPLLKFPSAALYWVLSGDDFTLDINNPMAPKILCIGNNPDRQNVYGTTLALYMSRIIKKVNHPTTTLPDGTVKRNIPLALLLDEFPTIFIKGIDNLIATARSNRVAVVLGAQDLSQMRRDYGDKESDVVYNTVGTRICGQVNGTTAKHLAEMFGRQFREQQSQTTGGENDTISRSYHQVEILPQSKIETLSQGYFFGTVADDNKQKIDKKLFCGEIVVDVAERERKKKEWKPIENFGAHYFDDEKIEKEIRDPKNAESYCVMFLANEIVEEERTATAHNANYTEKSRITCKKEARRRYDEMDKKEREALLGRVVRFHQDESMWKTINDEYDKIRTDVRNIFKAYGINLAEFDKKSGAQTPSSKVTKTSNPDETGSEK